MTTERRHQFNFGEWASGGGEGGDHFYVCSRLPDPFGSGGTLVRTMTWPKIGFVVNASGPGAPPWSFWAHAQYTWMAYYSVDGTVPPTTLINPYSGNCVLRSSLTPAVYPSPTVAGAYTVLLTCEAQGVQSKRMHKPNDPVLTAKVITGLSVNDTDLVPALYSQLQIFGSSNDYTIWEKQV